mmetsp:Transcript_34638/g.80965  ORF Transcript_34638/g.80965 Transcript_34638/m.80965 type:complete len:80 (+) Transcript_34638:180-419(+)
MHAATRCRERSPLRFIMARGPMLYYLHPDVSFFKGGGFKQLGPALDMPDNSAAGDVWNPPDTESTSGISYDNCEAMEAE